MGKRPFTEAKAAANKRYMEDKMHLRSVVTRTKYEEIKAHATKHGESVSGFVNRAVDEAMQRDNEGREDV